MQRDDVVILPPILRLEKAAGRFCDMAEGRGRWASGTG